MMIRNNVNKNYFKYFTRILKSRIYKILILKKIYMK